MVLLDPVSYPGAIKAFAKEVCRNDLLNFGRLHFFFPDSRLSLDLNTDKTLKACCVPHRRFPSRKPHLCGVDTMTLRLLVAERGGLGCWLCWLNVT